MKHRAEIWLAVILALCSWAGLVLLMNLEPPTATNQVLFLLIWGVAIGSTSLPLYRALGSRSTTWPSHRDRSARALRRAVLTGLLALALMTLHFVRQLTLIPAILLVLLALTVEVALSLRRH